MNDLISRQAAIELIHSLYPSAPFLRMNKKKWKEKYKPYIETEKALKLLPSAQPERKTGRWILYDNQRQEEVENGNYLYICSECGKSDIHAKTQEVPFCWWCGADMKGDQDDK